jgi:hypothetical protein
MKAFPKWFNKIPKQASQMGISGILNSEFQPLS